MIPISKIGAAGLVTDLPSEELPLNAWTGGKNVRFINAAAEKFSGHTEAYGEILFPPHWLFPIASGSAFFWLYASLANVGATDGSAHADITNISGVYTTNPKVGWTGTNMEGIAVINNGTNLPQMWVPGLGNKLQNLTAWPSSYRASTMSSLKRYLVALDITKGAVRFPHTIKWSHQAPSNAVPTSWDETDETLDAGEYTLPAEGGFLVDAVGLRDDLVLYKESQTWLMQYVGGIDIFRFTRKFPEIGMLTRRCAVEFFIGKHLVFTGNDVVVHDGQQGESIIRQRLLSSITNRIDPVNHTLSFVAVNIPKNEVWVCFPERGHTSCNLALVWNWREGSWGVRDLPGAAYITSGIVNPVAPGETWDTVIGNWQTKGGSWGDRSYDPSLRKMLMAAPGSSKLFAPDDSQTFSGVPMTSFLEKTAIGFPLKATAPPDYTTEKLLRGIWPRIRGTQGGVVNIYMGTQERINGPIVYDTPFPFIIGVTEYADCLLTSKLHALRFESTSDVSWILDGYDADVVPTGQHGGKE